MNIGIRLQELQALVRPSRVLLAAWLGTYAAAAAARVVNPVPEPSMLSLLGVGIVAGIIAYRIKKKK